MRIKSCLVFVSLSFLTILESSYAMRLGGAIAGSVAYRKNLEKLQEERSRQREMLLSDEAVLNYKEIMESFISEQIEEYEKMNFVMGFKYRYNPHNQYLDNIVRNGLLGGGISLLIIYIWPIIISYRRKDFLLLAFILIISCVCIFDY